MFAFVGVVLMVFVKEPKLQHIGQILAGLGVLFIGMGMMSSSMSPLRDSEPFIRIMSTFSNPLLGILAGAAFTAVIQSSSASVGILQALASSGVIRLCQLSFCPVRSEHRHLYHRRCWQPSVPTGMPSGLLLST